MCITSVLGKVAWFLRGSWRDRETDGEAGQEEGEGEGEWDTPRYRQNLLSRGGRQGVGVSGPRGQGAGGHLDRHIGWTEPENVPRTGRERQRETKQGGRRASRVSEGEREHHLPSLPIQPRTESFPPDSDRADEKRWPCLPAIPRPLGHRGCWPQRVLATGTLPAGCLPAQVPAPSPATWTAGWVLEAASAPGQC